LTNNSAFVSVSLRTCHASCQCDPAPKTGINSRTRLITAFRAPPEKRRYGKARAGFFLPRQSYGCPKPCQPPIRDFFGFQGGPPDPVFILYCRGAGPRRPYPNTGAARRAVRAVHLGSFIARNDIFQQRFSSKYPVSRPKTVRAQLRSDLNLRPSQPRKTTNRQPATPRKGKCVGTRRRRRRSLERRLSNTFIRLMYESYGESYGLKYVWTSPSAKYLTHM